MFYVSPSAAPKTPIKNGKFLFGAYNGVFDRFAVGDAARFRGLWLLPKFLRGLRIRSGAAFYFCDGDYIGEISLLQTPLFGFTETVLWSRRQVYKTAYRKVTYPGGIKIPTRLKNSAIVCKSGKRYIRLHFWDEKKRFDAVFDMQGDDARPDFSGYLSMNLSDCESASLSFCIPWQSRKSGMLIWKTHGSVYGWLRRCRTAAEEHDLSPELTQALTTVRSGYWALRTKRNECVGMGRVNGRRVSFSISELKDSRNPGASENSIFIDDESWVLPPVKITRPRGINGPWVIQDTECMVDLVFTPISAHHRKLSALILRTDYYSVYGSFTGMLVTGNGEKIQLKNFPGIGKKMLFRM